MDPDLAQAALSGDVDFLRTTVSACQEPNIFLSQHTPSNSYAYERELGNIFHLAAWNAQQGFFQEAIRILPDPIIQQLLTQPESNELGSFKRNPLHVAAKEGQFGIVKLILDFYRSKKEVEVESKPWLGLDSRGSTPLHTGLYYKKEECAMEIALVDMETLCKMVDNDGNSPLFLAMENGCNGVALRILESGFEYSCSGRDGCTPLHFVTGSTEEVLRRLLEKHPELIKGVEHDQHYTALHRWTAIGNLWPLEYVLKCWDDNTITLKSKRQLLNLIHKTDKHGNNPFHVVARWQRVETAQILANIYKEGAKKHKESRISLEDVDDHMMLLLPWFIRNNKGETPLRLAMRDWEEACNEFDSLQGMIDMNLVIQGTQELLFLAVEKEKYEAAKGIWQIQHTYGWSKYPFRGREIFHDALKCSNKSAMWMVEKMSFMTFEADEVIDTLHKVSEVGAAQVLKWLLEKSPSALKLAPLAWVEACRKGHYSTILAFIDNCPYFRELCLENNDTPLHHIWFENSEHYRDLLRIPIMSRLKNLQDSNGDTPLQKAIRNGNLYLTEVLLTTDDVNRSIPNKEHKTAMDLLVQACRQNREWEQMCKRNEIVLQTTYFQDKTNLLEVRNTLSVVAALLATITFTAGFTLPGGVKSDSTGKATLANKATFLVFLLADTLAMCSSMLVLVCLIWSMVCDRNRSLLLIDQSMPVLLLALYSTLIAFMTGVYVVIPHKSLWAAIVILVLCSIFIISSKRTIMYKLMDRLIPVKNNGYEDEVRYRDEVRLLEQGDARA